MRETLVVDASVAVKWVVQENGSARAVRLRAEFGFVAPELMLAECANILWKKAQRGELTHAEAVLAVRLLERSGVEIVSMRGLGEDATRLALDLGHPAYDGVYLALARRRDLRFVTADRRLIDVVRRRGDAALSRLCASLDEFPEG